MGVSKIWCAVFLLSAGSVGTAYAEEAKSKDAKTQDSNASAVSSFKSEMEKVSYAIGVQYGKGFKRDLKDVQIEQVMAGFEDGFKGNPLKLNEQEIAQTLSTFEQQQLQAMKQERDQQSKANLDAGKAFLDKNKKDKGVKTTDSGLQYKVVKEGAGATPKESDSVKVHYTGKLINGTVFDSSVQRGEPVVFKVNQVISGWTEALQLMKVGSKWELAIPAQLAYGERGTQGAIGPNEVLLFDVELLSIEGS